MSRSRKDKILNGDIFREKQFIEEYRAIDDNLFEIAFNIVLVNRGIRNATLIESYNFNTEKYLEYIKSTFNQFANLKAIEEKVAAGSQLLIYNSDIIKSNMAKKAFKDTYTMGQLLGFICPDELGGNYGIYYTINDKEFYAESCYNSTPEIDRIRNEEIIKKYERFKVVGDELGYNIKYKIEYNLKGQDILDLLINNKIDELYENRESVNNFYGELGYVLTANFFSNKETLEDTSVLKDRLKEKFRIYKKLWILITLNLIYNPAEIFFGNISKEESIEMENTVNMLEEKMYETWLI